MTISASNWRLSCAERVESVFSRLDSDARLLDLDPDQHSRGFVAGHWVLRGQRSNVQDVAVDSKLTHLGRPCPRLIPRCIDMVANFIAFDTVGPRLGDKPAVEIDALRVGWNEIVRRLTPLLHQDGAHPAVRPIAEIAAWVSAEHIGVLAGCHVFSREGLQPPGSELRAGAALRKLSDRREFHRISPLIKSRALQPGRGVA
jgi:hypothetical protein